MFVFVYLYTDLSHLRTKLSTKNNGCHLHTLLRYYNGSARCCVPFLLSSPPHTHHAPRTTHHTHTHSREREREEVGLSPTERAGKSVSSVERELQKGRELCGRLRSDLFLCVTYRNPILYRYMPEVSPRRWSSTHVYHVYHAEKENTVP